MSDKLRNETVPPSIPEEPDPGPMATNSGGIEFIVRHALIDAEQRGFDISEAVAYQERETAVMDERLVPTAAHLARWAIDLSQENDLPPSIFLVESNPVHKEALELIMSGAVMHHV